MGLLKHISTDVVQPRQRIRVWQETMEKLFGPLVAQCKSERTLGANFEYGNLAGIPLCRLRTDGWMKLMRTESAARTNDADFVKVSLQLRGNSFNEQRGRTTALYAGQWCVKEIGEPYTVLSPASAEVLLLIVPRARIVSRRYRLEDLVARPFSGRAGVGKLAFEFMANTFEGLPSIQPQFEHDVLEAIFQFIRLTMLEATAAPAPLSMKLVLKDRIKTYVDGHLRDPELSVERLAQVFGCSKRYLHKAFECQGTSIGKYLLRVRLERCRHELLDPAYMKKSVTDIAYSWGFNSANHFSHSFKDEYGLAPSDLRATSGLLPLEEPRTRYRS
jgi:AraC-like DNA-binding protein